MKSDGQKMAGSARPSGPDRQAIWYFPALLIALAVSFCSATGAQELYKYQDENGDWIYSDRPPEDGQVVERRKLEKTSAEVDAIVDVTHSFDGMTVLLTARNDYHAPVELRLEFSAIRSLELPPPDHPMTWVLPPRSSTNLLQLEVFENRLDPFLEYGFRYMPGDPRATHSASEPYRAPYAISSDHQITQAFPETITHTAPDSYYAVDLAMPVGTDVVAARDGIVFDIASKNYRSGLDATEDAPAANVVRILHDDGTYAIYAHLNTNTIRVKPGDQVERGQYIADSGNTGFSTGPHLHFVVVRNVGLRVESVPVTFLGANSDRITPASGNLLTAY
jgi:murein DD-endopeptidase MepM/ murein hydrolase activator NlpD